MSENKNVKTIHSYTAQYPVFMTATLLQTLYTLRTLTFHSFQKATDWTRMHKMRKLRKMVVTIAAGCIMGE